MKRQFLLFFLFLSLNLNATKVILSDIKEYKIDSQNIKYKIEAKSKMIDYDKLKKFRFYNKKAIISNASYYTNGNYSKKDLSIDFKKAYFLEGNFMMFDLEGKYKNIPFKAKEAKLIKKDSQIDFKKVFINLKNKRYRKIKYSLPLN